jgi:hypothetical protein
MKHIYRDAHKVVVWLGERSDDSASAPDFIDFLVDLNEAKRSNEDLRTTLDQEVYCDKGARIDISSCESGGPESGQYKSSPYPETSHSGMDTTALPGCDIRGVGDGRPVQCAGLQG